MVRASGHHAVIITSTSWKFELRTAHSLSLFIKEFIRGSLSSALLSPPKDMDEFY